VNYSQLRDETRVLIPPGNNMHLIEHFCVCIIAVVRRSVAVDLSLEGSVGELWISKPANQSEVVTFLQATTEKGLGFELQYRVYSSRHLVERNITVRQIPVHYTAKHKSSHNHEAAGIA
jgi:hypothetical protein